MTAAISVFCEEETVTGLVIVYDYGRAIMSVGGACHPLKGVTVLPSTSEVECAECGRLFSDIHVIIAALRWPTSWELHTDIDRDVLEDKIVAWVSDWTAIEKLKLSVDLFI